ncbi:MAG: hypothetical protein HY078_12950 [Elusimicrobia bacterium]|nr:hypothetical protein [Elusimicrobiota bacterium]
MIRNIAAALLLSCAAPAFCEQVTCEELDEQLASMKRSPASSSGDVAMRRAYQGMLAHTEQQRAKLNCEADAKARRCERLKREIEAKAAAKDKDAVKLLRKEQTKMKCPGAPPEEPKKPDAQKKGRQP